MAGQSLSHACARALSAQGLFGHGPLPASAAPSRSVLAPDSPPHRPCVCSRRSRGGYANCVKSVGSSSTSRPNTPAADPRRHVIVPIRSPKRGTSRRSFVCRPDASAGDAAVVRAPRDDEAHRPERVFHLPCASTARRSRSRGIIAPTHTNGKPERHRGQDVAAVRAQIVDAVRRAGRGPANHLGL